MQINDTLSKCMYREKIISTVFITSCEGRKMLYGTLDNAVLNRPCCPTSSIIHVMAVLQ